jgi:23S rRNA (cytosine1962-C5)-methyltransferase
MWVSGSWTDYELLDATNGRRLERWGDVVLSRPDPQVIWRTPQLHESWGCCDGEYIRRGGGGSWHWRREADSWTVKYRNLIFLVKPTDFKHTGLFPEQAYNWDRMTHLIQTHGGPVKLLNLFAYTGGATAAAAAAGAEVTHVDAAKGMVAQARENAALSGLSARPIRWIIDDCAKFVEREIRRGKRYDAIIMDPPSYGRGPNGEVWKLEERLFGFLQMCRPLLSDNPCFVLLNTYTTGLAPGVLQTLLALVFQGGNCESGELGLPITSTGLVLPAGAGCWWTP